MIHFQSIEKKKRDPYFDLLLIGDEGVTEVEKYLDKGELLLVLMDQFTIGVMLFIPVDQTTIELKNFGLLPEWQRKGFGGQALMLAIAYYRERYQKMEVGTGNSSLDNLAFYQKCGFRMVAIKSNFFSNYAEPIYENGIRCLDLVVLEKTIENN